MHRQTFNYSCIIIIFIPFIAHFNIKRYDHDLCVKPLFSEQLPRPNSQDKNTKEIFPFPCSVVGTSHNFYG